MAQTFYYRYVGQSEADYIAQYCKIRSNSGITWFTPIRYDNPAQAQQQLAMPSTPTHRVGPIPADELPDLDAAPLRPVGPKYGHPGGAVEGATSQETYVYGIIDLSSGSNLIGHMASAPTVGGSHDR